MFATWALAGALQLRDIAAGACRTGPSQLYMLNPMTSAVELFHYGFWHSTTDGTLPPPPNLVL